MTNLMSSLSERLKSYIKGAEFFEHKDVKVPIEDVRKYAAVEARAAERLAKGKRKASSPTHANYITYLGPNTARFASLFASIGQVTIPQER